VHARLVDADRPLLEEGATTCCYHHSEKTWISDPQGVAWETFLTTGESTVYGHGPDRQRATAGTCCAPETPAGKGGPTRPEPAGAAPCCGAGREVPA
jgi:hypothetical protein